MSYRPLVIGWLAALFCVASGSGAAASAAGMDLVGLLTQNLGVTGQQAEGGAGAIFNAASKNMSVTDFGKVTEALPEVASLMKAAPAMDSGAGTLGGLSSALGQQGGSLSTLSGLTAAFSKLGLGGDMVGQFIPIVLDYAQSKGGDGIANLLKMALQ